MATELDQLRDDAGVAVHVDGLELFDRLEQACRNVGPVTVLPELVDELALPDEVHLSELDVPVQLRQALLQRPAIHRLPALPSGR
jgi:hypothetical protein